MHLKTTPSRSTPLEDLSFEPDGVRLTLDGHRVNIPGSASTPPVAAFHSFYHSALADYHAQSRPTPSSSWLLHLRSWFGRIFSPRPAPAQPASRAVPILQAAFGDREGVHLNWQVPPPEKSRTLDYPLDSALAGGLQQCYHHLGELGYKVVGLELLQKSPEKRPATRADPRAEEPTPAHAPKETVPAPEGKKARTVVVRLAHPAPETPSPAAESAAKPPVLAVPEQWLRVLQTAAHPDRPAGERLTFLRCSVEKDGLKIIDVGLGEDKERGPAHWEDAEKWAARQAEPERPAKRPRPAPEAAAPVHRAAEPELDL